MLYQFNHDILCHLSNYFLLFDSLINLYDVKYKYLRKLTDIILKQQKYNHVRYLHVSRDSKITTIGHMRQLRELRCDVNSGINQDGIRELFNLEILYVSFNEKISNVNHMQKLRELHCVGNSGINQNGIRELFNLEILGANEKISDVNHMQKLRELRLHRKINQVGIREL